MPKTVNILIGKMERSNLSVFQKIQTTAFAEQNNLSALSLLRSFLYG